MIYFISGSGTISRDDFYLYYVPTIDKVLENDEKARFVIGGCKGVDRLATEYLNGKYCKVTVCYCGTFSSIYDGRNDYLEFSSLELADQFMTKISDFDIAFVLDDWDNSFTAKNIIRRHYGNQQQESNK